MKSSTLPALEPVLSTPIMDIKQLLRSISGVKEVASNVFTIPAKGKKTEAAVSEGY